MSKKLTLTQLKDMYPHKIFASGHEIDSPEGINIADTGQRLKWIAVRGRIHDWAIYAMPEIPEEEIPEEVIHERGGKVMGKENINKLVPSTDEAFKMYRY